MQRPAFDHVLYAIRMEPFLRKTGAPAGDIIQLWSGGGGGNMGMVCSVMYLGW